MSSYILASSIIIKGFADTNINAVAETFNMVNQPLSIERGTYSSGGSAVTPQLKKYVTGGRMSSLSQFQQDDDSSALESMSIALYGDNNQYNLPAFQNNSRNSGGVDYTVTEVNIVTNKHTKIIRNTTMTMDTIQEGDTGMRVQFSGGTVENLIL